MRIRPFTLPLAIAIIAVSGLALAQDGTVDTLQDVQSTSEAATAPDISDENSKYLSGGGFDSGSDTSGSNNDGSDLQPAPTTVEPNE
jgi:hypothetical protein